MLDPKLLKVINAVIGSSFLLLLPSAQYQPVLGFLISEHHRHFAKGWKYLKDTSTATSRESRFFSLATVQPRRQFL